ncbi:DNA binding protein [Microbacterium phage Cassita]|nr:DNA binding protein [Microbacterium phage Cassita]
MTDEIDPRIERIIWRGLGLKTIRQLSEETGLPPEKIHAIKRELFESVDVLTTQQKKHRLMVVLEEIAQATQEDYDNAPYEFKAGLANSAIASMKTMMTELNRTSKDDQAAIDSLNALRVRELFSLMQEVVETSVEQISESYGLDRDDLFAVFNGNLQKAAQKRDELPA